MLKFGFALTCVVCAIIIGLPAVAEDYRAVQVVHYLDEPFIVTTTTEEGVERIVIRGPNELSGACTVERNVEETAAIGMMGVRDDVLRLQASSNGCYMSCAMYWYFSYYWDDCDGYPPATCQKCVLVCPGPPPPPDPTTVAFAPSYGIQAQYLEPLP